MKTILKPKLTAFLCAGLLGVTSTSVAQDARAQTPDRPAEANQAANLDDKTSGSNIRVSQLIGMNIENSAGENVGKIDDMVIDAREYKIRYVAVTYGGFLGFGSELHAVPFEAFKFKTEQNDSAVSVLVLNVTQEQIKGAKGFDKNKWPNFADKDFTRQIDERYGIDRQVGGTHQAVDPAIAAVNTRDRDNTAVNARDRDNSGVNVRDRDRLAKTSFDQKENQTDISITANIRKRVVDTNMSVNAKNVKIITQDGKVTLRGPVKSADERTQIEKVAQQVAGSANVDNQLEVQR